MKDSTRSYPGCRGRRLSILRRTGTATEVAEAKRILASKARFLAERPQERASAFARVPGMQSALSRTAVSFGGHVGFQDTTVLFTSAAALLEVDCASWTIAVIRTELKLQSGPWNHRQADFHPPRKWPVIDQPGIDIHCQGDFDSARNTRMSIRYGESVMFLKRNGQPGGCFPKASIIRPVRIPQHKMPLRR